MQTPTYRKNALIISILLGVVFVICLIFVLWIPRFQKTDNLTALIYQDGSLIHTIDLGAVSAPYELTVSDNNGHYNLIEVRPGSIGIVEADCPDKLCVHMGFQNTTLLPITCLPNNVVVRIVTGNSTPDGEIDFDGISY